MTTDNVERLEVYDDMGTSTDIVLMRAKSRRGLSAMVRQASPGHIPTNSDYDCTGKVCGRYATMLRAYRRGREWVGVVAITTCLDI